MVRLTAPLPFFKRVRPATRVSGSSISPTAGCPRPVTRASMPRVRRTSAFWIRTIALSPTRVRRYTALCTTAVPMSLPSRPAGRLRTPLPSGWCGPCHRAMRCTRNFARPVVPGGFAALCLEDGLPRRVLARAGPAVRRVVAFWRGPGVSLRRVPSGAKDRVELAAAVRIPARSPGLAYGDHPKRHRRQAG